MPAYTLGSSGHLVLAYENSRNELMIYGKLAISLIKEGFVQKVMIGVHARGSNDFLGCVYAEVLDNPHFVAVDKETLCASPTLISNRIA